MNLVLLVGMDEDIAKTHAEARPGPLTHVADGLSSRKIFKNVLENNFKENLFDCLCILMIGIKRGVF